LPAGPAIDEQREALDFADVPIAGLMPDDGVAGLAARIVDSDVVYCV
jgi:hypothetical protein